MKSSIRKTERIFLAIGFVLAIAMIVIGTAVTFRHSEWATYAGVALFLVTAAAAAGGFTKITGRSHSQEPVFERKVSGRKISNGLVALSSAAILVVYAAGYDRTSIAADRFSEQAAAPRRRVAPTAGAIANARMAVPAIEARSAPPSQLSEIAGNSPDRAAPVLPSPPAILERTAAPAPVIPVTAPQPSAPAASDAPAPAASVAQDPADEKYEYADGAFLGWGTSRHGDLEVQVVIQAGQIVSAAVSKCRTQYSCVALEPVYRQVVKLQDPDKIDNVTGATDSTNAYYGGVVNALNVAAAVKKVQNQYSVKR